MSTQSTLTPAHADILADLLGTTQVSTYLPNGATVNIDTSALKPESAATSRVRKLKANVEYEGVDRARALAKKRDAALQYAVCTAKLCVKRAHESDANMERLEQETAVEECEARIKRQATACLDNMTCWSQAERAFAVANELATQQADHECPNNFGEDGGHVCPECEKHSQRIDLSIASLSPTPLSAAQDIAAQLAHMNARGDVEAARLNQHMESIEAPNTAALNFMNLAQKHLMSEIRVAEKCASAATAESTAPAAAASQ